MEKIIATVSGEVVSWRRYLHRHPELSFQEVNTAQFVYDKLKSFDGLELARPTKTSVVAKLVGAKPGKVLALRADMDALPLQEENGVEYRSTHPGIMHACGHDGHTAMLLGAAKILSSLKEELAGEIRFIFQHAEEQPPGGAGEIVTAGVLDGVDSILGIHLSTDLEVGKIGVTDGAILANTDTFDVVIKGKGGHGSRPEACIDPIIVGAQVVTNLQQIVSRQISALQSAVVSVTFFQGGMSHNIIPSSVKLGGTVRSFGPKVRQQIAASIRRLVKGIAEAHGTQFELVYQQGYSAVVNDKELAAMIRDFGSSLFGKENVVAFPPRMAGEDFSAYLEKASGCFVFIGAANTERGLTYSTHNPRFDIDEQALANGLKVYVQAAFSLTSGGK